MGLGPLDGVTLADAGTLGDAGLAVAQPATTNRTAPQAAAIALRRPPDTRVIDLFPMSEG